MPGDFETILNNSLSQIYEKYKDRDDSLDNIIEIEAESLSVVDESAVDESMVDESAVDESSVDLYGDEDENFSFIRSRRSRNIEREDLLALDFYSLYNLLFYCETVEDILGMIE